MLSLIPKFSLWPTTRPIKTQKGFTTIAVGAGGLIARSTDGVTWTEPVSGVTTDLHMAAYGGGVWMIVGASSTILKSTDDGVTWVKLTLSSDITTNVPMGVASIVYDAGRFLVITNNRMCIFTTDNGATWTRINASSMHVNYFKSRARRWSTDGKVYQNGGGSGNGYTVFSWNGSNYTATNETVDAGSAYIVQSAIAFSDAVAVSLQQGGKINRKPSGGSWSRAFAGANNDNMYDGGVAYNSLSNTFYAIGNMGSAPALLTGVDGSNWQQAANAAAMFGATQTLSDISAYDKNSFIVGGTKIFVSTDWSSWSLAYTASKTFNSVFTRERVINTIGDAYRWRLVSLKDLEYIEDVTEKFLDYTGTLSVPTDKGYRSTSDGQSITHTDAVVFKESDDFTISLILTPAVTLQANMGKDLHIASGDIATNGGLGTTWYLSWATNFQNFIFRYYKADGTSDGFGPSGTITIPANTDFHIEIGRKNDTLYFFYNGVKQTVGSRPTGLGKTPAAGVKGIALGSPGQTSYGFNGWRRNFVIDRGTCRHTESFTPELAPMTHIRSEYAEEDAKAIRAQFDMRRDSNHNVASGRLVNFLGYANSYVRRGRYYFGGTQSATANCYQMQMDPWGAGDFTIEASLLLTAIGTNGAIILAEWYYGTSTDDRNRWAFSVGNDRKAVFGIAASPAGNSATYLTSNYAMTLGVPYKVIVERVNGVVSIYVLDVYSGTLLDTVSVSMPQPIRGAMPHVISNSSQAGNFWAFTGQMWDIRIADKAMYNGKPAISAAFPAFPDRRYSVDAQANVAAQFTGSNPVEQIQTAYVGVSNALIVNNQITIQGGNFVLSKVTQPFMNADFTIEARVGINTVNASPTSLCGQFLSGRTDNTWQLRNVAGKLVAVLSKTGGVADTDLITLDSGVAWVVGQEYYIVIERIGSTITLYVDGVVKATAIYAGAFPVSAIAIQRGDYNAFNGWLRDLRCSRVAQYGGNVPKFPQYPRVRKPKPYITVGFQQGGVGTIYGYLENSDYSSQIGFFSLGSCSQKLWQINGIVRRLKGLFLDRGNYMVIGWEDTNIQPSADIPTWTNTLEVNGTQFSLSGQPYSGFTTPLRTAGTGTSVYWSGAASVWGALQEGRAVSFDFV